MNLAILHYHLNRGGVTQVIMNHLEALDRQLVGERVRAAILFGGRHDAWLQDIQHLKSVDVSLCCIPQLDYCSLEQMPDPTELAEQIVAQLNQLGFAPRDTIIHTHNSALGLNAAHPGALLRLAERGYRLLLQHHDFAEDFRPACFEKMVRASRCTREMAHLGDDSRAASPASSDLPPAADTSYCYPQSPHIHYAVINRRDHGILLNAGVPANRLHLIPNPVAEPNGDFPREPSRRKLQRLFDIPLADCYVLYPVRCIRRKNVGEALLWSALVPDQMTLGLTLPPENPSCATKYGAWKELARTLHLPCRFEVGREGAMRYPENIAAADIVLTTSLVEGFGMVYLETWLTEHALIGRDLPEVTQDFVQSGLRLDSLQPNLAIPLEWVGAKQFADTCRAGYDSVLRQYGVTPKTDHEMLEQRIHERLDTKTVDFGELCEEHQGKVIRRVAECGSSRRALVEANQWMYHSFDVATADNEVVIKQNADTVRTNYGFAVGGERLWDVYRELSSCTPVDGFEPLAEPGRIIDAFLDARRYRPVAT